MKTTTCKLGLLTLSDACQTRASARLDADHVEALVAAYTDGEPVPPIACVEMADGALVIVDGYHRHTALVAISRTTPGAEVLRAVPVLVRAKGDADVASYHALAANAAHGIRRSAADKRHVCELALAHPTCQKMGVGQIAQWLGVSSELLAAVRTEILGATSPRAEATAKAATAAAKEITARAKGNPPRPVTEIAEAAGVSPQAVARALSPSTASGRGRQEPTESPQSETSTSPHAVMVAALEAFEVATRAARKTLATGDLQAFDAYRAKLLYIVRDSAKRAGVTL